MKLDRVFNQKEFPDALRRGFRYGVIPVNAGIQIREFLGQNGTSKTLPWLATGRLVSRNSLLVDLKAK
jgi:hypothetical protein